jgi:hypothetical protein
LQSSGESVAGAVAAAAAAKHKVGVHEGRLLFIERAMAFAAMPDIGKIAFKFE